MSRLIAFICLLGLVTSAALADDPSDQSGVDAAYARLKAKEAAATQPADISTAELNSILTEVAELRAENAALKVELAKLTARAAAKAKDDAQAVSSPTVAANAPSDDIKKAMAQNTLAIGMTLDQCNKSIGRAGELKGATTGGQTYEWGQYQGHDNLGNPAVIITYTGIIEEGKLVSFNKSDPVPFNAGTFGVSRRF